MVVDLACDVALETPEGLLLGEPFFHPSLDVVAGTGVADHACDDDPPERGVGLAVASAAELKPGQTRKEAEGVFLVRTGKAEFLPIKMGVAGDKYFEVMSGLKPGDQVITGPYNSVRGMADGDLVKVDNSKKK